MNQNTALTRVTDLGPYLKESLPETYSLLSRANLVVHPLVSRIVLHGSRGPASRYRPDSDIDLSLIADQPQAENLEEKLAEVITITLDHWQAPIEADLAVIFDIKGCGLRCFEQSTWHAEFCQLGGMDCFGLFKLQKGFHGFVVNAGIQVRLMYPCLKIWQREDHP